MAGLEQTCRPSMAGREILGAYTGAGGGNVKVEYGNAKEKEKKKGGGWMGGGRERRREEEEELSLQLPIYLSHLRPTLPPHLMCVSCCFVAVTHESTQPVHLSALVPTVRQGGVMAHVVVLLR